MLIHINSTAAVFRKQENIQQQIMSDEIAQMVSFKKLLKEGNLTRIKKQGKSSSYLCLFEDCIMIFKVSPKEKKKLAFKFLIPLKKLQVQAEALGFGLLLINEDVSWQFFASSKEEQQSWAYLIQQQLNLLQRTPENDPFF